MLGVFAAFSFRVIFALITVQLLQFPILKIIGGALLIWVILKLVQDLQLLDIFKSAKPKIVKPKKQPSFIGGVYAVLIADVTLSFDNVLGVAAASFFAEYIKKHSWVGILGLIVIFVVALQLIVGGIESQYPGIIPEPFASWI